MHTCTVVASSLRCNDGNVTVRRWVDVDNDDNDDILHFYGSPGCPARSK